MSLCKFIDTSSIASLAASSSSTVKNSLNREVNLRESVVSADINSISKCWGWSLSPTWTAICWNVLVFVPWKVVGIIDRTPIEVRWHVFERQEFVWSGCENYFWDVEFLFDVATFWAVSWEEFFCQGFDHVLDGEFVLFMVHFQFCLCKISPSILWICPSTVALNPNIVNASNNLDETLIIPSRSPRVSDQPVFNSIENTIPCNWNSMNNILITSMILINTSSIVVLKICWNSNTTSKWPILQFSDHIFLTRDRSKWLHPIGIVTSLSPAFSTWLTVHAKDFITTWDTIVVASSLVVCAGLICDVVVVHPCESTVLVSTMTSVIWFIAWDEDLRSDIDVRPYSFPGYLDSITKWWRSCKCPTWPTILRNMLIPCQSQVIHTIDIIPK